MKMNKIYIDLDNTLCDLTGYICDKINKEYALKLAPVSNKEIVTYDYLQLTFGKCIEEFWSIPGIYDDHINPLPGSIDFIYELKRLVGRFNIAIITATPEGLEEEKKRYCLKHFGISNVICTHEKWKHTRDSLLIDDYWKHCMNHIMYNNGKSILFNHTNQYPYANADGITWPKGNPPYRATSYDSIMGFIEDYVS